MATRNLSLIRCKACNGLGEERGVFDWLVCMTCRGLGEVPESGEHLTDDQIIDRLRLRNRHLKQKLNEFRKYHDHLQQQLNLYKKGNHR